MDDGGSRWADGSGQAVTGVKADPAAVAGQMLRFALTGGLLALLVAGGDGLPATVLGVAPVPVLKRDFLVFWSPG